MSERYVRHISGQGEKWEIKVETSQRWIVDSDIDETARDSFHLPKSEYRLCDPPEVWRDVTADCALIADNKSAEFALEYRGTDVFHDYRIRKVEALISDGQFHETVTKRTAFLVERREP